MCKKNLAVFRIRCSKNGVDVASNFFIHLENREFNLLFSAAMKTDWESSAKHCSPPSSSGSTVSFGHGAVSCVHLDSIIVCSGAVKLTKLSIPSLSVLGELVSELSGEGDAPICPSHKSLHRPECFKIASAISDLTLNKMRDAF